jgi:putative aldouronate transport system substrate-binding protein
MKRKLISLAMATIMITLTACSGGSKATTNDTTKTPNEATKTADGATATGSKTLNFLTQSSPLAPADPNDKLIWKRYEEKTGIHINWTNYTWDVFAEKRNLKMATNDLPDAIFDAALSDNDILTYATNGVIVPVEDLIDKYMPNLKALYDEYPEYRAFATAPDGHIYTFPWIEELGAGKESIHSIDCIPWINTTWLKNLGLEMPTTTDELTNVLRAFKEKDANQNGDLNDEIPMTFIFADKNNNPNGEAPISLLGAFGYGDNPDHIVVTNEGKVIYTLAQEGYKEGIKWFNQLYTENLIDPEVFTQDWNKLAAKGKEQRFGLFFTWDMGNVSGFVSGDYSDPDNIVSDYAALPPLAGPDGKKNITRTNGFGLDRGRMAITVDNKDLETTAKWIDGLYEPLQSVQDNWGTYGDTAQANIFELDGNMLKHLPLNGTSPNELRQKTMVGGPLAVLDKYYGKSVTLPDDAAWRMKIVSDVYAPHMQMDNNFPRVFYTREDQVEFTQLETVLKEYAMSMEAEFIKSGNVDARWNDYLKELDRLNLPRFLEIRQTYYDAFTK